MRFGRRSLGVFTRKSRLFDWITTCKLLVCSDMDQVLSNKAILIETPLRDCKHEVVSRHRSVSNLPTLSRSCQFVSLHPRAVLARPPSVRFEIPSAAVRYLAITGASLFGLSTKLQSQSPSFVLLFPCLHSPLTSSQRPFSLVTLRNCHQNEIILPVHRVAAWWMSAGYGKHLISARSRPIELYS